MLPSLLRFSEILERVCAKPVGDEEPYRPIIIELEDDGGADTLNRLIELMVCCWGMLFHVNLVTIEFI